MPDCLYTPSPCAWTLCFCIKRSVVNQWLIPGDKILEIQRKRVGRGDRGHNSLKSLYPTEYCRPDYYAGTNVDNIIIIKKLLLKWSVYFFFQHLPLILNIFQFIQFVNAYLFYSSYPAVILWLRSSCHSSQTCQQNLKQNKPKRLINNTACYPGMLSI